MAREALTIAGAAVGFFFGGPGGAALGAQIGGFVGGLVDPPDSIKGPRLTDLQITASTYGTAIPLIYGPENRIAGNIIWTTGLIESKKKESAGGKGGGQSVTTYSYRVSVAIALGQGTVEGIRRIWANSKLLFDIDELSTPPPAATADVGMVVVANGDADIPDPAYGVQDGGPYSVIRFYQGTATQQIDPTIEAHLGAGNTPAYRHTAYLVIQDLQLADYGNGMPNIEVEVVGQSAITVGGVVRDVFARAGVGLSSTSAMTTPLRGYVVAQAGAAFAALQPLTNAYYFDIAEQGGQLRCIRRGRTLRGTIPIGDMGARQAADGGADQPVTMGTATDLRMPQQVSVNYSDPESDYQVNTQRASRAAGSSEHNLTLEIPMVLTADDARRIADRALWEAWAGRRTARFPVSDRWVRTNPGDVLGFTVAGEVIPHRMVKIIRGHDGVLEIDAIYEDPESYLSSAVGAAANIPDNPILLPGVTRLVLIDMPIARDADDDAGFYWVASGASRGWRGADIQRSSDGGVTYSSMAQIGVRATIGDVATALPPGPADIWDRGNVLTVVLHYEDDQLEGLPDLAVLNGGNAAWLGPASGEGGEIIQFASATLIAPQTYELRGLLRGRLGTEHAIGSHGADEVFVLLEPDTLNRTDYGVGDWGRERLYRPVSILTAPADAAVQSFQNDGVGRAPLAPVHIDGERDGGNDLTITWVRRTRLRVPGLGRGPVPLGELTEAYEIDVLDGATVVRTISSSTTSAVYTAAEQTADGLTPGDPVDVVVYQISDSRGRGFGGEATV